MRTGPVLDGPSFDRLAVALLAAAALAACDVDTTPRSTGNAADRTEATAAAPPAEPEEREGEKEAPSEKKAE